MSVGRYLVYTGPLVWAVLIVFHPSPAGDSPYEGIADDVDRWLVIHVGQLILTPFLFLAVWGLLDDLTSTAARVSRADLVVWTVFFTAYDSLQGVATGILARRANDLAGEEQAAIGRVASSSSRECRQPLIDCWLSGDPRDRIRVARVVLPN